ncbi:MAG: hypothetical protein ACKO37_07015 [Vampirovibrionales bacterium]
MNNLPIGNPPPAPFTGQPSLAPSTPVNTAALPHGFNAMPQGFLPSTSPNATPTFQVNAQLQAQALSHFEVSGQKISLPPGATATVNTGQGLVTLKAPAGFVPAGGMQTPTTQPPNPLPTGTGMPVGTSVAPPNIQGTSIASGVQAGLVQGQLLGQQQQQQQLQQLWQQLQTQAQTNQTLAQALQGMNPPTQPNVSSTQIE